MPKKKSRKVKRKPDPIYQDRYVWGSNGYLHTRTPLPRLRSRDLRVNHTGSLFSFGSMIYTSMDTGIRENCEDHLYNWTAVNPFSMYTREQQYPVLNGTQYSGGSKIREFTDFPIGYKPGPVDPWSQYPSPNGLELSDLAWNLLAQTNPNQTLVSVPSFVGELKDFFSLIKGRGEHLIRQVAQGYISWRWALRPLYHDMQQMLRFRRAFNERLVQLMRMRDGKEVRKRKVLRRRETISSTSSVTIHSQGAIISGKTNVKYTEEVWGTSSWKLAPSFPVSNLKWIGKIQPGYTNQNRVFDQYGFSKLEQLSNDTLLGFTPHEVLATSWQLMPWSWLIDWCTSYGDIIEATNNTIPLTWSKIAIMKRTTSVRSFFDFTGIPAWCQMTGPYWEKAERKERYPAVPLPFSLPTLWPFLEGRHLSILAALAVSHGRMPV